MLLPVVALVVAVGAAVAGTVVAVVRITAALAERHGYAVLLALGVGRWRLYATALVESAIATVLGTALGVAAGVGVAHGLAAWEPRFLTAISPSLVAAVSGGALAVGLLAALPPARAVARLDPAVALRG